MKRLREITQQTWDESLRVAQGVVRFQPRFTLSLVEDAVQEMYLDCLQKGDSETYDAGQGSRKRYSSGILRNKFNGLVRKNFKERQLPEDFETIAGHEVVEDRLEVAELMSYVEKAFNKLPPRYRVAIREDCEELGLFSFLNSTVCSDNRVGPTTSMVRFRAWRRLRKLVKAELQSIEP